jgi:hypothetical protein
MMLSIAVAALRQSRQRIAPNWLELALFLFP